MERFFRTPKADLERRSIRPWNLADFERRLVPALIRYAYCRPHSALDGRVPAEALFGIKGQRPLMNLAPRGRARDPEIDSPFEILFLDPESETLPILVPKAA